MSNGNEGHDCLSDLACMKQNGGDYADTWYCVECAPQFEFFSERPRFPAHYIIEMLRERAAAQDAAKRLHRHAEPIQFQELREQGVL